MDKTREDLAKQIGRRMELARLEAKLSRKELGDRLGLSERGYGHLEAGRNLIGLEYLLQLPFILGKPLTYFLPGYIPNESERDNPRLDPRFQYIEKMWSIYTEDVLAPLYRFIKNLEYLNPYARRAMKAAGIEPPPLPDDLSEAQREILEDGDF